MQNHNPDLSSFQRDRHGYPTLPDEEWANWEPIRPIISEHNYDIAHVFNSGWMRRVTNPNFDGNGNPAIAVIHKDKIPDLHAAMGGGTPEDDLSSSIMGYWDADLEGRLERSIEALEAMQTPRGPPPQRDVQPHRR